MKIFVFLIGIALCAEKNVEAAEDFSKEIIKVTQLTPSLSMLEGAGGNITASIGADGVLLVDCDFAGMSDKLVTKLKELKGGNPRFIINTHFHYDHSGGNQVFGQTATIISATQVRNRLMNEQILWKKTHPAFPSSAQPKLTFDDSIMLHVNSEEIKAVHFSNGHTDGDTVVFFQKGSVASLGDLYFAGMYPIFHPEHQGDLDSYLHNLELILKTLPDDSKVVPGHGPLSNKQELDLYREMIVSSISIVRHGIKKHMTLEQIQKRGLPKKWEMFSHGYRTTNQWIQSIYQSIQASL